MTKKKNTSAFTPIFLHRNEALLKGKLLTYEANLSSLQTLKLEVEGITKESLSEAEITALITNPVEYIENLKSEIKKKYPFPDSDEATNLNLLGISFKNIDEILHSLTDLKYKYLVNAELEVTADPVESVKLKSSCDIYTTNERQNTALEQLTKISEATKVLQDEFDGEIVTYILGNIERSYSGFLTTKGDSEGKSRVTVYFERIISIK